MVGNNMLIFVVAPEQLLLENPGNRKFFIFSTSGMFIVIR